MSVVGRSEANRCWHFLLLDEASAWCRLPCVLTDILHVNTGDREAVVDITAHCAAFVRGSNEGLLNIFVRTPRRASRSLRPAPEAMTTCSPR